jgi:hypothetical protein
MYKIDGLRIDESISTTGFRAANLKKGKCGAGTLTL